MYSVESVNGLQLNTKYNQYVYHLPINEHIALIPSSYKSVFKSLGDLGI